MGVADLWYENIESPVSVTVTTKRIAGDTQHEVATALKVDLSAAEAAALGVQVTSDSQSFHIPVALLGAGIRIQPGDKIDEGDDTYIVQLATRTSFASRWECPSVKERGDQDNYE